MKQDKERKKFRLDKRTIASLNTHDMKIILTGQEAEPDFLSIFACKTRKCLSNDENNCVSLLCTFTNGCELTETI
jgi:hypothetical protein